MNKVDVKEKARTREQRILQRWRENDTFRKSVEARAGRPNYVFYEGPPTANGTPHIGHALGRVIKDFICRYKTMEGYRVVRKAGWDTHGLPVELGVEKQLGISGKQEIEKYGVGSFVETCRSSVFEYEKQWRELTEAIGYWTDMDHPYITLTNEYIESVWHIMAEIHRKGLLYQGHRVSPYCPSCQTTLSSHEVGQGYEDVKDLSATVKFRSRSGGDVFLAWTTTPWTLPANAALAVNPQLEYIRAKQGNEVYVVARGLADQALKPGGEYETLSVHQGAEFVGMAYEPPFGYFAAANGHRVIAADFVSDASGTGIVHIAPAHGEDDYHAARDNGIGMVEVVDRQGKYKPEVTDYAGRFVKDCDVDIVKDLARRGLLYDKERYEHSYPFCWRCKTPLLYYALESWFIRTTAVKTQLIANNRQVEWFPEHLRDGRFGKFLEDLVDWNISRSRYWGTPLNVWICGDCHTQYAPSGLADLQAKAAHPVSESLDLHKPNIDEVKLRCPKCQGLMERTPEVIDVWFDSGSMPFAQYHYPFENEAVLREQFPADMICEAIDQTRGWFFVLLAVSTLLTGKAPYKRVISTGHILDENGKKMSKSKGNSIDPWEIIEEYGADAFRWALLSDSAPWNSKRFSKSIVTEAKSKVIDTLNNVHAFFALYASIDGFVPGEGEEPSTGPTPASSGASSVDARTGQSPSPHLLDRWMLSRLNSTLKEVTAGLSSYDFLNPAKSIEALIDDLSNWYVRRSRDRFWGSGLGEDKLAAYEALREVLLTVSRMVAPYAPFVAEEIYLNLAGATGGGCSSVHLTDYPAADESLIDLQLERQMQTARRIVELARSVRNVTGLHTRQPLQELLISAAAGNELPEELLALVKDEINVRKVRWTKNDSSIVDFTVKLNLKTAGPKLGRSVAAIQRQLSELSTEAARAAAEKGTFQLCVDATGETLHFTGEDLLIEKKAKPGLAFAAAQGIIVALNTEITPELAQEGLVRELIRAVQDCRKRMNLPVERRIHIAFEADVEIRQAVRRFDALFRDNVLVDRISFEQGGMEESVSVGGNDVRFRIEM